MYTTLLKRVKKLKKYFTKTSAEEFVDPALKKNSAFRAVGESISETFVQPVLAVMTKMACALSEQRANGRYTPAYRVVEICQTEEGDYEVCIQMINKSVVFTARPEEILAKDSFVDLFSPRDIRALTYIGYLSVNSPKYKILAQKLSAKNDKTLFALQKKGEKKIIIKTADEILKEKEILDNLNAKDSQVIGYTVASENILAEQQMKEAIKRGARE